MLHLHYYTAAAATKILDLLVAGDSDALTATSLHRFKRLVLHASLTSSHNERNVKMRCMQHNHVARTYTHAAGLCICAALLPHCRF